VPRVLGLRGTLVGVAVAALLTGLLAIAFGRVIPNYDDLYAIAWGHQLAHGETPQYFAAYAPAAHPGLNLLGVLASPLGPGGALAVFELLGLVSLGALAIGLFCLGEAFGSRGVGVAAALILLSRPQTISYGLSSLVDAPTAALVVWAAVLEARAPRRGTAVLVLLAIAGFLRPEPWLLAAAYAVWCAVRQRPRTVASVARPLALAAVGPVLWLASDWIVTGDPLSRFHTLAPAVGGRTIGETGITGLSEVPRELTHGLGNWLGPIPLALAVVGCVAGLALRPRLSAPPLAAIALSLLAFAAAGGARSPLEQRYLFTAVALLAFFAGVGLVLAPQRLGTVPGRAVIAIGAAALVAGFVLRDAGRIGDVHDRLAAETRSTRSLEQMADAGRATLRGANYVFTGNPGIAPLLAVRTGRPPQGFTPIRVPGGVLAAGDAAVVPLTPGAASYLAPGTAPRAVPRPSGGRVVARTRDWLLVAR
jgi:hypothetical protein